MGATRKRKKYTPHCGWCSIPGHQMRACHIQAEGRQFPDTADYLACVLTGRGKSPAQQRGRLARLLRSLIDLDAVSADPSMLDKYLHGRLSLDGLATQK